MHLFVSVSDFLQQITYNYTYRNYLKNLNSSDLISLPQGHSLVLINRGTERIGFQEMGTILVPYVTFLLRLHTILVGNSPISVAISAFCSFHHFHINEKIRKLCFIKKVGSTMKTNLPKLLDLLIFCIYSLNFSLEFFIMIFFATNQLNISKFLPTQIRKTLISY